jgi:hypothetical protein
MEQASGIDGLPPLAQRLRFNSHQLLRDSANYELALFAGSCEPSEVSASHGFQLAPP